ncbi:AAA family ATPase [Crocosphaera sp. UHCC 0190]|uniref:AAA family ATPase n=1 Tax=Crocosphaera sp. UHCC 0190 TaxID=3110246 RepID=UPI002B216BD9|nr:AAA family ATPase [Crocosphaera sp. UHCC 0190]MEA5511649.1 AAA family ATPase [Crocosphaera sp. UHCC 0190]
MKFYPKSCRNEREVESKLIVQYLLPQLGYSPDNWHQEVCFGNIRLDFLTVANKKIKNFSLCVVIEAKHPQENLDHHVRRLGHYLTKIKSLYGVLTNGKDFRIYQRQEDKIKLVFCCSGETIESNIVKINALIGKESLQSKFIPPKSLTTQEFSQNSVNLPQVSQSPITESKKTSMKVIAIYHHKGGVGKTTVATNLAAAFSNQGKRVLLIDIDAQANTTFATGLIKFQFDDDDDLKDKNVFHLLESKVNTISDIVRKSQGFNQKEIDVIPSHIMLIDKQNELARYASSRSRLVKKLELVTEEYDLVIIDTPPSLDLYAESALTASDYIIIPSDLKPFSNQGLRSVKNFLETQINDNRETLGKPSVKIMGVLPSKISTHHQYLKYTFPKQRELIATRYNFPIMENMISERTALSHCINETILLGELEIPAPKSIFYYANNVSSANTSAAEFESLAIEVLEKIGA